MAAANIDILRRAAWLVWGRHLDRDVVKGAGEFPQRELTIIYQRHCRDVYLFGAYSYERTGEFSSPADLISGTAFQVSSSGLFLTALHAYRSFEKQMVANEKFPILRGTGPAECKAFPVELVTALEAFDIAILQGIKFPRTTFIPTADTDALPGGLVSTIGYAAPRMRDEGAGVVVDHRYSQAMVSGRFNGAGGPRIEIDRSLSNLQSGSPIIMLSGYALALATEQVRDWVEVNEQTSKRAIRRSVGRVLPEAHCYEDAEEEDLPILERRFLKTPIDHTLGTLFLGCADALRRAGVPVVQDSEM